MSAKLLILSTLFLALCSCKQEPKSTNKLKIIQLNPTHSHAAAAQNELIPEINPNVYVYSPDTSELKEYFNQIRTFNSRKDNPTRWNEVVYSGKDYLEKMAQEKKGNVVVLAGNNRIKIDYIVNAVKAGLNVFSDKPMVINKAGFEQLKNAYAVAGKKGLLMFDMMTERYSLIQKVQKSLMQDNLLFGKITQGTPGHPAIFESSIHHFYRGGKGSRPYWYFDVLEQGEGIVDVTTHLIDLTFWKSFPDKIIDYQKDIKILSAKRWPVSLTRDEFKAATSLPEIPSSLNRYMKDSTLQVFANGSISYQVNGICTEVKVEWRTSPPKGGNDLRSAWAEGTKAKLMIQQEYGENRPKLCIKKDVKVSAKEFQLNLERAISRLQQNFPGVTISKQPDYTEIVLPSNLENSRDQTFKVFVGYLLNKNLPSWEVPNTLAKYYITTTALETAQGVKSN